MTEIEIKLLIQDFVLITYDIPAKEKKLRRDFLNAMTAMGAEQYTESVYLLPYTYEVMELAAELESAGHAVVWRAYQPDEQKALEINNKYEQGIKDRCTAISQRLAIVQDYIAKGWLQRAQRMGMKTGKMLQELAKINDNYEPGWLKDKIDELVSKWKEIHQ